MVACNSMVDSRLEADSMKDIEMAAGIAVPTAAGTAVVVVWVGMLVEAVAEAGVEECNIILYGTIYTTMPFKSPI